VNPAGTPPEPSETTSTRGLVIGLVVGLPIIGYGVRGVFIDADDTRPRELAAWIIGSGVLNDLVLIPLVLFAGLVARRCVPTIAWAPVRAGLIVTGVLCLVAWPFVRGYGRDPSIPSVLNRNYAAGLGVAIAVVWAVVALWLTATLAAASHRRRRQPGRGP
jgi:hypothetical protein